MALRGPRTDASSRTPQAATTPQVFYDYGADVVLSGEEHVYERFAPLDAAGNPDPDYGVRQFVVGTGGGVHYTFATPLAASEARIPGEFGVLELTLRPGGYDWRFVPQEGKALTDSGTGLCHRAPLTTTIVSGPPPVARGTSATFRFASNDPGAHFEITLDGGAATTCAATCTLDPVPLGAHTLTVRAVAADGTADRRPLTYSWTSIAPAVELLANGSFESGTTGWGGFRATLALLTGGAADGAASVRATWTGATGSSYSVVLLTPPGTVAVAQQDFTANAYVRAVTPGKTVCLRIRERTPAAADVGSAQSCVVTTGAWQRFPTVVYRAAAAGNKVDVFAFQSAPATGDSFDVDGFSLVG